LSAKKISLKKNADSPRVLEPEGAGILAYVIIPGLLVIWDRVLDHMESGEQKKQ
jgi:hypothetical protein